MDAELSCSSEEVLLPLGVAVPGVRKAFEPNKLSPLASTLDKSPTSWLRKMVLLDFDPRLDMYLMYSLLRKRKSICLKDKTKKN